MRKFTHARAIAAGKPGGDDLFRIIDTNESGKCINATHEKRQNIELMSAEHEKVICEIM